MYVDKPESRHKPTRPSSERLEPRRLVDPVFHINLYCQLKLLVALTRFPTGPSTIRTEDPHRPSSTLTHFFWTGGVTPVRSQSDDCRTWVEFPPSSPPREKSLSRPCRQKRTTGCDHEDQEPGNLTLTWCGGRKDQRSNVCRLAP